MYQIVGILSLKETPRTIQTADTLNLKEGSRVI
jgi:hypothetical protein